jgi:WD40 repeat protein
MLVLGLSSGAVSVVDERRGTETFRNNAYDVDLGDDDPLRVSGDRPDYGVCVATAPDGSGVASGHCTDAKWRVWNLDGTTRTTKSSRLHGVDSIKYSPNGKLLAVTGFYWPVDPDNDNALHAENRLEVFDAVTHEHKWGSRSLHSMYHDIPHTVTFSGDSMYVAVVCQFDSVGFRLTHDGLPQDGRLLLQGIGEFCPTNHALFAVATSTHLEMWRPSSRTFEWQVPIGEDRDDDGAHLQNFVRFSPDGDMIATRHTPGIEENAANVCIVDARNGEELVTLDHGNGHHINDVCFSTDGRKLACVGRRDTAQNAYDRSTRGICVVWDPVEGSKLFTMLYKDPEIRSVAFGRDDYNLETDRRLALGATQHAKSGNDGGISRLDAQLIRMILDSDLREWTPSARRVIEID